MNEAIPGFPTRGSAAWAAVAIQPHAQSCSRGYVGLVFERPFVDQD